MIASTRWFRNIVFMLALCMAPLMVSCVCVAPRFNTTTPFQCISDADCNGTERCQGGVCRSTSAECTSGIVRSCFLGGPSTCQYGEQTCVNGRWGSCIPKTVGTQQEVCDGIDNNCDGRVDESFPEKGQKCIVLGAKGACANGTYTACVNGQPQCTSTQQARAEGPPYGNCNDGIDNDCDGFIDDPDRDGCAKCTDKEVRKCYPHGQGVTDPTVDQGVCKVGSQTCINGSWEPCKGAVTPTPEQCGDKLDNDCDGKIDNNCNETCDPIGSSRPCYGGPEGTQGVGTCQSGVQVCEPSRQWGVCKDEILPAKEDCTDGKDNDCNGKIDDCGGADCKEGDNRPCYSGPANTSGVGVCISGSESCTKEGKWSGTCTGEVVPSREVCGNSLDDNCNGKVDDCSITELASASWDKLEPIKLWDTTTNKSLRSFLSGHTDTVYAAVFSPDGKTLYTSSHDKLVVAWDPDTAKILWSKADHTGAVHALAIDPNGKWLASGSADSTIRMWDPATGASLGVLNGHTGAVYSLASDPTGKVLLSGGADTTGRLWDVSTLPGTAGKVLTSHSLEIFAVAFHPKGTLIATGSRDTTIKLWDPATGGELQTLSKHTKSVTAMAFSQDGKWLASGSSDESTVLWDVSTTPATFVRSLAKTGTQAIYAVTFHPILNTLATGTYSGTIVFWDPSTGSETATYPVGTLPVSALAYRP